MKKIIYTLIFFSFIIILTGCGGKKEIVYGLYDKYVLDDLVFKNIDIKEVDGYYYITSILSNNSNTTKDIKWYKLNVTLMDDSEKLIIVYFGDVIEPNQTLQTITSVDFDVNQVKSINYEID